MSPPRGNIQEPTDIGEKWRPVRSIMLGRGHPVKPQPGLTSAYWTLRGLWLDRAAAGQADPPPPGSARSGVVALGLADRLHTVPLQPADRRIIAFQAGPGGSRDGLDLPVHGKHLPSGEDGLPGETEPDRTRPGPTRTTIRCGEAPALDAVPELAHAVFVAYQTTGFLGGLNLPVHGGAPPFGRGNRHWRKMRPVGSIMTW